MINFSFGLSLPFLRRKFRNLYCKSKRLHEHLVVEIEVFKTSDIVRGSFELYMNKDVIYLLVGLGLFGYELSFAIFDNRHYGDTTGEV